MEYKKCLGIRGCQLIKPLTEFRMRRRPNDRLYPYTSCRTCENRNRYIRRLRNNPDQYKMYDCIRKHRRRIRSTPDPKSKNKITSGRFKLILDHWKYCCAYCGVKPDKVHIEHVNPVFNGGTNETTNLLPSCRDCNLRKGVMSIENFCNKKPLVALHKEGFQYIIQLLSV